MSVFSYDPDSLPCLAIPEGNAPPTGSQVYLPSQLDVSPCLPSNILYIYIDWWPSLFGCGLGCQAFLDFKAAKAASSLKGLA